MKKLNFFLTLVVFVFAIGTAISNSMSVSVQGYIKKFDGTPVSSECVASTTCSDSGTIRCLSINDEPLFKLNSNGSACDVAVFHQP